MPQQSRARGLTAHPLSCLPGRWGENQDPGGCRAVCGRGQSLEEAAPLWGFLACGQTTQKAQSLGTPSRSRRRLLISGSRRLWGRDYKRVQNSPASLICQPPYSCLCWLAPLLSGVPLAFPQGGTQGPAPGYICQTQIVAEVIYCVLLSP